MGALTWVIWGFVLWMINGGPSGPSAVTSLLGGIGVNAILTKLGISVHV